MLLFLATAMLPVFNSEHNSDSLQARQQRLSRALQMLWADVPAWTATLLFMFQPVAQSVSLYDVDSQCAHSVQMPHTTAQAPCLHNHVCLTA